VGQLSALQHAVAVPPDLFSFAAAEHKVAPLEGLPARPAPGSGAQMDGSMSSGAAPNGAWLCVDLMALLCGFTADPAKRLAVLAMLEAPIKACPEVGATVVRWRGTVCGCACGCAAGGGAEQRRKRTLSDTWDVVLGV
jgi:hypothetical protein